MKTVIDSLVGSSLIDVYDDTYRLCQEACERGDDQVIHSLQCEQRHAIARTLHTARKRVVRKMVRYLDVSQIDTVYDIVLPATRSR